MTEKTMNTAEYLEHLTREEKRSALLAQLEDDPAKKKAAKRANARIKRLIRHVRKLAGGGIETAEMKAKALPEIETAEQKKEMLLEGEE